jgi:KDO2-lipid IV(A) lauroyltransferase
MARLFIGESLRGVVERWPLLHKLIWGLEAGMFGLFLLISWCLPLSAAQSFASAIMGRAGPRQRKHHHVLRNLGVAFPERSQGERDALGRQLWGNVGKVFAEYAHLYRLQRHVATRVDVHGIEHVQSLSQSGRPAVLVTPHLGNWEIIGCVFSEQGVGLSVVYTPLQNPYLDRMIERCRRAHSSGLLARDDNARALLRELAAGRCVGFVMDQRVDSGVKVPLFGVGKSTTLVPARLALRQGIDLLPVRTERLAGGRFRVTFYPPVRPSNSAASPQEQALDMTHQINGYFESWIRERPADWFCTNRLWPKDARPAGVNGVLAEGQPGPA